MTSVVKMRRSAIELQFDRLNQAYWKGRLPSYRVFESDKYAGGLCLKSKRQIYITRGLSRFTRRKTLLHEMCHAAVGGNHGKAWRAEMLRIAALGAPTKREAILYSCRRNLITQGQIVTEFEDAGFENPDSELFFDSELFLYGLVDTKGRVPSVRVARFIHRLRSAFRKGQRSARKMARPRSGA